MAVKLKSPSPTERYYYDRITAQLFVTKYRKETAEAPFFV